jgi:hypothetical protein
VENDLLAGFFCQPSTFDSESRLEKNSFLTEQSGNVIENKGLLWKTWGRSWNVYEKKVLSPIKRESY